LRFTAEPTARPAAIPTRTSLPSLARTTSTNRGCAYDLPLRRTFWKSSDRVSRYRRCIRALSRGATLAAGKPGLHNARHAEWRLPTNPLHVLVGTGSKPLATAQAAPFQHGASLGRGHACPETMHPDAPSDLRLIGSLRHDLRSSLVGRFSNAPLVGLIRASPDHRRRSVAGKTT
jgi:hypothetical protein